MDLRMKRSSGVLVVWLLLSVTVLWRGSLWGRGWGANGWPIVPAAPHPKSASAASASSHAFTAAGGSRVAEINLSQEARDVINTENRSEERRVGKECRS